MREWVLDPAIGRYQLASIDDKVLSRLAKLRLAETDFRTFSGLFVGSPFDFVAKRPSDLEFRPPNNRRRPVSPGELVAHIAGELVVSVGCGRHVSLGRHRTRSVVIDLDRLPGASGERELRERYARVLDALGEPTLRVASSESGGLHLYYLLDEEVDLYRLRSDAGGHGIVSTLLAGSSLLERPGEVEIYPRGSTRTYGQQNRLRLPLGDGSLLLDRSLAPETGNRLEDIRHLARLVECERVEPTQMSEWVSRAHAIGTGRLLNLRRAERRRERPVVVAVSRSPSATRTRIDDLLETGLTDGGQRNAAVMQVAGHYRAIGLDREAVTAAVRKWLRSKNNGKSADYNRSPGEALRAVEDAVKYVFRRPSRTALPPAPPLTLGECEGILEVTDSDLACSDPSTGELLSRLKLQRFLFAVLSRAKGWAMVHPRTSRQSATDPSASASVSGYSERNRWRVWTRWYARDDEAANRRREFVVPIPLNLRQRIDGLSDRSQGGYWRAILATGLVAQEYPANALRHRCAEYRVSLVLYPNAAEPTFDSIDDAIGVLYDDAKIRRLYSRHFAAGLLARRAELAGFRIAVATRRWAPWLAA